MSEKLDRIMKEKGDFFPFIKKLSETSWKVEHEDGKNQCSFQVDILSNGTIVMTGDFGGLMVQPYTQKGMSLNWMAGATDIDYFAEKVWKANRSHKCTEFSADKAMSEVNDIKNDILENLEDYGINMSVEDIEEKFEDLDYGYYENIYDFYNHLERIADEFDYDDIHSDVDPELYTESFIWQHECLLFWANKILEFRRMAEELPDIAKTLMDTYNGAVGEDTLPNIPDTDKYTFVAIDVESQNCFGGYCAEYIFEVHHKEYQYAIGYLHITKSVFLDRSNNDYECAVVDKRILPPKFGYTINGKNAIVTLDGKKTLCVKKF